MGYANLIKIYTKEYHKFCKHNKQHCRLCNFTQTRNIRISRHCIADNDFQIDNFIFKISVFIETDKMNRKYKYIVLPVIINVLDEFDGVY